MASEPGVWLDGKLIGLLLGMISLATVGYTGISKVNAYAFKVDQIEVAQTRIVDTLDKFDKSVSDMKDGMTDLTIAINRLNDRYEILDRRAENRSK